MSMKRNIFLLVAGLFLGVLAVNGQASFQEVFKKALDAKDMTTADEVLKAWDLADANDPELYVAYFNFFTVKSQQAAGNKAYEPVNARKALEFISEGIDQYPTRFDMWVAKIYMLGALKDYGAYTDEIVKMIAYSKKIENDWKGDNFSLIKAPDELFKNAILNFQNELFKENNPACDSYVVRIAEEMLKHYPNHVQSLLNLSTMNVRQKKYDESLEFLLKAEKAEPKNAIVLYNLAYVYNLKDNIPQAKKYYELSIANAKEEEAKLKESAQKLLQALNR
jgi:tetratricopeptide (TPR) repeat protein